MQETEKTQKKGRVFHIPSFQQLGKDKFIIMILAGILLFIIAIPVDSNKDKAYMDNTEQIQGIHKDDISALNDTEDNGFESNEGAYVASLEQRLSESLSYMRGVGKVKVMITLKSSAEKVVEKDIPSSRSNTMETDAEGGNRSIYDVSSEESTVYITEDSGAQTPYVVKNIEPIVAGVVVIAQGGNDAEVSKNITEAVQALFNLEAHKIKVLQMKTE